MIGAIAGDIIGSVYEHRPIRTTDFPLFNRRCTFTDDTVLTVAVAATILGTPVPTAAHYRDEIRRIGRRYPDCGYGMSFIRWLLADNPQPYNSWGNGAAMRVSPIGFAFDTEDQVLRQAAMSAGITHNHPEGIKGAQATALAVFLARSGRDKETLRHTITNRFGYDLDRSVESIRGNYSFDISCQGTVPEAIVAFLDSDSWESAVRNAVSFGGDSDTLACIAGGVAEAFYGAVPPVVVGEVRERLPPDLLQVADVFEQNDRSGRRM